jgi:hypothetical protein
MFLQNFGQNIYRLIIFPPGIGGMFKVVSSPHANVEIGAMYGS